MKIFTPQIKAAEAAARWKSSYFHRGEWGSLCSGSEKEIYEALLALGDNPEPSDVNRIIGNTSWTETRCDECRRYDRPLIVQLGEEPDYESATANVCGECLTKAVSLAGLDLVPMCESLEKYGRCNA